MSSRGYSGHHHLIRRPSSSSPGMSRLAIHPGSGRSALQLQSRNSPFPDTSPSTRLSLLWMFYPLSFYRVAYCQVGFPGGSDGQQSACSAGDPRSIPGSGRSPGGGHGNPLQCSCLDNPMDRGAWRIPWTEEPGGLQSMRLQRVGRDLTSHTHIARCLKCCSRYISKKKKT